ncbi:unnamed protein product [Parnassius apollo]|uniref:(apollo) hypothetical protein n=1 Tax=Parnassius apollo TaxID=110799 RepID=A0A8S3XCI8_PARAO|nr:unnamed protein product [Parnassius apollo]
MIFNYEKDRSSEATSNVRRILSEMLTFGKVKIKLFSNIHCKIFKGKCVIRLCVWIFSVLILVRRYSFTNNVVNNGTRLEGTLGRNGPKHIKTCQNVALAEIARQFGLMNDLNNMMKIFIKLRFALVSRLRRLIRRCVARGWPSQRALLLAPKWLRVVETRIRLLPLAIRV